MGTHMKWACRLYRRWRQSEQGQSLVEFALTLPVLLLLVLGTIDIGMGFRTYIALSNAAREGARWVSIYPNDCAGALARIETEAARVGLAPSGEGSIGGGGYTPPSLNCPYAADQRATVTVTIAYDYELLFGIIPGVDTIPFRTSATMVVLYDKY